MQRIIRPAAPSGPKEKKQKRMVDHFKLTPREDAVMKALCEGLTEREIADHIGVQYSAINGYKQNAKAKLGAETDRVAIILYKKNISQS